MWLDELLKGENKTFCTPRYCNNATRGQCSFCLNIPMYTFHTGTFHKRYTMGPETLKNIFKKQKQMFRYILNMAICPKKAMASLIKLNST